MIAPASRQLRTGPRTRTGPCGATPARATLARRRGQTAGADCTALQQPLPPRPPGRGSPEERSIASRPAGRAGRGGWWSQLGLAFFARAEARPQGGTQPSVGWCKTSVQSPRRRVGLRCLAVNRELREMQDESGRRMQDTAATGDGNDAPEWFNIRGSWVFSVSLLRLSRGDEPHSGQREERDCPTDRTTTTNTGQ